MYIPLDERPCNLAYPQRLFEGLSDIELIVPPLKLMGHKKQSANPADIRQFIDSKIGDCQLLVLSTEMLAYGGLLPSRIYPVTQTELASDYATYLTQLKAKYPQLVILVSNLIMRTPKYSSSDEEPDYYADYGSAIFKYGWLQDKKLRSKLSDSEQVELSKAMKTVPKSVMADYQLRRQLNVTVNLTNINLVATDVIDYLVIPQDDSAPFGFTAMDQAKVYQKIKVMHLENRISVYPGADEVGYTLLARAVQSFKQGHLTIYPIFSGAVGQTVIPLYEDRPLIETLQAQILATGAQLVSSPAEADLILAVNVSGQQMREAADQIGQFDLTYDTFRNLRSFVSQIQYFAAQGLPVALADCAYANGGDLDLLSLLDQAQLISQLKSYRAWNTDSNTLGSTIATAIILFDGPLKQSQAEILNNLMDDVFYQAIVRKQVTDQVLPKLKLTYFDLGEQCLKVQNVVETALVQQAQRVIPEYWQQMQPKIQQLRFPWNRMFEIEIRMEVTSHGH